MKLQANFIWLLNFWYVSVSILHIDCNKLQAISFWLLFVIYFTSFADCNPGELIRFQKHNVYIKGERYKEGLIGFKNDKEMQCDAVPSAIDPMEGTSWVAKVMWRGKRPSVNDVKPFQFNKEDMSDNIKQVRR